MSPSSRTQIITGNWKMYKTRDEALKFVKELLPHIKETQCKVYLAVPFTLIEPLVKESEGSKLVIGAQNMNDASEGAFTGEISGRMLNDVGAKFVLIGHSERRRIFKEDNAFINRKVKRALLDKLQPILCVGETKEEREANQTEGVLRKQLTECLTGIDSKDLISLIVAYEPVWAIGTMENASPEVAEKAHLFCRQVLGELLSQEVADQIIIQYGGSVSPQNAGEILSQPDINGLLIGGASLSLESFVQIVHDSDSVLNRKVESL